MVSKGCLSEVQVAADLVAKSWGVEDAKDLLRKRAEEVWNKVEDAYYPIVFATSDPDVVVTMDGPDSDAEVFVARVVRE